MAEIKKPVAVAKAAEPKKEEVKAVEPVKAAEPAKKETVKKATAAKKAAPAKKATTVKKAEPVKKAAPAKKEAAKKAEPAKKEAVKKAAPAKKTAAKKTVAKEAVYVQFAGKSYSYDELTKLAKTTFKATKNKEEIKSLDVYVNVDDSRAYFVINGKEAGSAEI